ncbi:MAG: hypothetical protein E2O29_01630 [Deltaproteobacteria bacterium]|nr:MAG: hypothetical protein E2O29_01630 [Deltaproteobacteria bacterium]
MRKPRELKESAYLQRQLPKITTEDVKDMHDLFSIMGTKKFWEFFNSCTNAYHDTMAPNEFKEEDPITDKFDPNNTHFINAANSTTDFVIPNSSNMTWQCGCCGLAFVSSWSPVDEQAHGFPNPLCPCCGKWDKVKFIK